MLEAIGAILPFGVGVALSPVPIIAVILMLMSARARVNGPMFIVGWLVGLAVGTAIAQTGIDADRDDRRGDPRGGAHRARRPDAGDAAAPALVMAQDLGQVGDVLATEHADAHVQVNRTVDDAIAAVGAVEM